MLIKFTGGGRGGGRAVAEYLTREEGRGHAPPEVVRGDMDRTRDLIDSIERQWTYTHGVLSFAPEDMPTEEEQEFAMDAFERLAFAGLDREQYDISWVRHSHTESGRTELHFVTPRMELTSGKALNIAPPHWESTYATLRDTLNLHFDWARPDDPERALELQRAPERAQEGYRLREGREGIHEHLTGLVAAEAVTDRASMVRALRDAGLEVTRESKEFITVRDPETDEKFRMKGRIYEKDWTYDRELDRAIAPKSREPDSREREDHQRRTGEAIERYKAAIERRASQNSDRYRRPEPEHQRGLGSPERDQPALDDRGRGADLGVGDPGRLLRLALDAEREARSDLGLSELHAGRQAVSGLSRGERDQELPDEQRRRGVLRNVAERGVSGHERETDSVRARFVATVRGIGSRLRERLEQFGGRVREVARAWQQHEGDFRSVGAETVRSRTEAEDADRSLRRANEAHRGLAGAIREIGAAGERVAGRTTEMTREREARERAAQERTRSRDYGMER